MGFLDKLLGRKKDDSALPTAPPAAPAPAEDMHEHSHDEGTPDHSHDEGTPEHEN